jgi:hypothetical protein
MLLKHIRLFLLLAAPALVGAAPSRGAPAGCALRCRCVSLSRLSDSALAVAQWQRADAVVLARVVAHEVFPARAHALTGDAQHDASLRAASGPVVVRLAVERRWKGEAADTLVVAVQAAEELQSSCDLWLHGGRQYLVFATRGEIQPVAPAYARLLGTARCSGTREADGVSAATLRALDAASDSAP